MPILFCDCHMLCICFLNRIFLKSLLLIRNIMTGYTAKKSGAFRKEKLLFFYYSNIMPKGPLPLEYEHPSAGTVPKETICRRCLFA